MRATALLITLSLCTTPLAAQDAPAPSAEPEIFEGLDDLADGMRKLFEGFQTDVAPLMENLAERLKGIGEYHPPEVLPNGDIIIRRKRAEDPPAPTKPDAEDGIDI